MFRWGVHAFREFWKLRLILHMCKSWRRCMLQDSPLWCEVITAIVVIQTTSLIFKHKPTWWEHMGETTSNEYPPVEHHNQPVSPPVLIFVSIHCTSTTTHTLSLTIGFSMSWWVLWWPLRGSHTVVEAPNECKLYPIRTCTDCILTWMVITIYKGVATMQGE